MRERVKGLLIPLIGGVAEHNSLIASTEILLLLISVDSSGNVGVLSLDDLNHIACSSVKSNCPVIVANV